MNESRYAVETRGKTSETLQLCLRYPFLQMSPPPSIEYGLVKMASFRDFVFNKTALKYLKKAGWTCDRDSQLWCHHPLDFEPFPEAERIVRQFGGLVFSSQSGGEVIHMTIRTDDYANILHAIKSLENKINRKLYPIGYIDYIEIDILVVDENGVIYRLYIDHLESEQRAASLLPFTIRFDDILNFYITVPGSKIEFDRLAKGLKTAGLFGKEWLVDPWKNTP